ncbi:MAG: DUF192 domain-containing protein [Deltaproteobacteria bacterium]|nr:DUF192 domain-containing protein [Deltaproteobacteria bacterium]
MSHTRPEAARPTSASLALGGLLLAAASGCERPACDESIRAQVLDERVLLELGDETVEAELADDQTKVERGWMHRRCNREGILLVPPQRGPLPIWGCGLVSPVDLHFIRDGQVRHVVRGLEPCGSLCSLCPLEGEDLEVDGVLETPVDALTAEVGTDVRGWP